MSENLNPIVLEVEEVRVVNAVSPTVDLGRTENGALVTVHDYRGTQTVEILDGPVGPVGPQGPQGESGAETAKAIVEEAISRMEDSIHDAQTIGQTVAGYRDAAAQSASNAALSEDAAALSAQAASQSAQAASQSASNAAQSERNAADSAQDAHDVLDSIPADYSALTEDVTDLKSAINAQSAEIAFQEDSIPGTTQTITFDADGNVQRIVHSSGNTAVRTDVFTFGDGTITEVRTLATGESLTIVTDTDTLETTTTYAG